MAKIKTRMKSTVVDKFNLSKKIISLFSKPYMAIDLFFNKEIQPYRATCPESGILNISVKRDVFDRALSQKRDLVGPGHRQVILTPVPLSSLLSASEKDKT